MEYIYESDGCVLVRERERECPNFIQAMTTHTHESAFIKHFHSVDPEGLQA